MSTLMMDSTLTLRYMRPKDITQVVAIDREAFAIPWSPQSYAYEIGEAAYSYMVVLERAEERPVQGWRRLIRNFNGGVQTTELHHEIVGYGGLWNIADEAHISTIATRSDWRGNGYGELMLASMIHRAIRLEASYIVLEVRVSNEAAQNLYRKYGFKVAAVKSKYYHDNGEDAYDMRLNLQDQAIVNHFYERYRVIRTGLAFIDLFSDTPRPVRRSS